MRRTTLVMMAALLLPIAAFAQTAQTSKSPVSDAVRSNLERSSKNIIAAVDEMPADKYSFHPTADQMTFAHLVVHMTNSNNTLCSKISGTSAPAGDKPSDTDPKDKLVSALKASFDFCTQSLANVDDSNLSEQLSFGSRSLSRAAAMIALTNDFADHYSTAAAYLRANALLPPTAHKM